MSGRGERERSRRDYVPRSEERRSRGGGGGRSNAPPSRHLWVGSLAYDLSERTLREHLLRFGELESVAFLPGRGYAFVNYKYEDDAFAAFRALQGFVVAGNPLKIEFAKSEKSSTSPVDEEYSLCRDDQRSFARESAYRQKERRAHQSSPRPPYSNKSKIEGKIVEPSEVLWIGFPAVLKVDETNLRKAFSPFGEIVNITAFPGRSYAFVRFRNVMSACRAKDTLHGKLFGNPRVHICFAKSESTSSGRNPGDVPSSPDSRPYGHIEASEKLRHDRRSYENISGVPKMMSPHFISDMESPELDFVPFQRQGNVTPIRDGAFERGLQDLCPELRPPLNMYEHQASPPRGKGARFRDYSPQEIPRQGQLHDDAWDMPEDAMLFHESKRLKTTFFPHENELPEYSLCDPEQATHELPIVPDYHQLDAYNKNFDSGSFGCERIPDRVLNNTQPYVERSEHWDKPYNSFQTRPVQSLPNPVEWKRLTQELHHPSPNEVWKWEGTIAKGGTPICRARCFPVGKLLDIILPDFLDCTARTDLDMLAKHYYESASAWVVFFVPGSDVDIASYNELMNYLGEKQRAAVAKIDENTTLFLVPPSEFSEKVLKVPGKLSISGVILSFENSGPSIESLHIPPERKDTGYGSYSLVAPFTDQGNPGVKKVPFPTKLPTPPPASYAGSNHMVRTIPVTINDNGHIHQQNPSLGPNWPAHNLANLNTGARNRTTQPSNGPFDSISREYNPATATSYSNYTTGFSGNTSTGSNNPSNDEKPPSSSSLLSASLQPEKLAQLASSLLGQQRQLGVVTAGQDFRHSSNANQSNVPVMSERELSVVAPGNQQYQSTGTHEDGEADPQKRLQATLQLAAALIQQIQQGKQN